jgi:glycosyltransferase involved in cell wall biosynthesis
MILLTIMIPTTIDRRPLFKALTMELWRQIFEGDYHNVVNIVFEEDDKQISVGLKRQHLLEGADGEFIVGFDSDDYPAPNYISEIVDALINNPDTDHVGFIEDCDINGQKSKSIFSIKHKSWDEQEPGYDQVRCANPKSVIRRSKALQVGYQDMRFGEDRIFSEVVTPLLTSEVFIEKPLYFYRHDSTENSDRYGFHNDLSFKR